VQTPDPFSASTDIATDETGQTDTLTQALPQWIEIASSAQTNDKGYVLEQDQRLSRSLLWKLQRSFYERQGVQAWSKVAVPHYITNNPFITKAYARVVFGFLQECSQANPHSDENTQPFYIIELGSGSGRFAYQFLKHFLSLYKSSTLRDRPFKYIMTDLSVKNLASWQAHDRLCPFVEQGVLDFATFDADHPQELLLLHAQTTLSAASVTQPLVLLANYVLDSLPQDCFTLKEGQFAECLLTTVSSQAENDLDDPELLYRLSVTYRAYPTTSAYYDDPNFNQILQNYQQHLSDTTFLFPLASLRCLQFFRGLARGQLLLLSSDKGDSHQDDLLGRQAAHISLHGNSSAVCFSMMVNYHAIGEYVRGQGGQALYTAHHTYLNICAFLLGQHPNSFAETSQVFHDVIEQGGPDDFFVLREGLEATYANLSLRQLLAYFRISGWDSTIFLSCFPILFEQVKEATGGLLQELHEAIQHVWELYYPIGEEQDLAFSLGVLLYAMGQFSEALNYLQHSIEISGHDATTLYNMAVCHYQLQDRQTALEYLKQALQVNPACEPARALQITIESGAS
jgi:tetratricopeptide (TPR) repeat protein